MLTANLYTYYTAFYQAYDDTLHIYNYCILK